MFLYYLLFSLNYLNQNLRKRSLELEVNLLIKVHILFELKHRYYFKKFELLQLIKTALDNNFMNTNLSILLIDDESAIQRILKQYFYDKHEVVTHNNGREALIWLYQGNLPDIIIADINMPILNGQGFIKEIKSSGLYSKIPVIMLSGEDKSEIRIKCLNAGADDFMLKPFNPKELEARLHAVLRRANPVYAV